MELIPVGSTDDYAAAVRLLFPPGEYWDRQFEDPDSDVSLFIEVKAAEIARFQERRSALMEESLPGKTAELIDDWERTVGISNRGEDIEFRRAAVQAQGIGSVNWERISTAVERYGGTLDDYSHPVEPAFFGFTRFRSRMATPAWWNVIELWITLPDTTRREDLEAAVTSIASAFQLIHFLYRTETDEYLP